MIELGKEYETREGKKVTLFSTNMRHPFFVVCGLIHNSDADIPETWTADGHCSPSKTLSHRDLVPVRQKFRFELFTNINRNMAGDVIPGGTYHTRELADERSLHDGRSDGVRA